MRRNVSVAHDINPDPGDFKLPQFDWSSDSLFPLPKTTFALPEKREQYV